MDPVGMGGWRIKKSIWKWCWKRAAVPSQGPGATKEPAGSLVTWGANYLDVQR